MPGPARTAHTLLDSRPLGGMVGGSAKAITHARSATRSESPDHTMAYGMRAETNEWLEDTNNFRGPINRESYCALTIERIGPIEEGSAPSRRGADLSRLPRL